MRTMGKSKRLLSLLLTLAMVMSMFPAITPGAKAADAPTTKWEDNIDQSWYDTTKTTYDQSVIFSISTPAELAAFAKLVNDGTSFAGKTVSLAKDIDLSAHLWTPIGFRGSTYVEGQGYVEYYHFFNGVFEGNNKTVTLPYMNTNEQNSINFGFFGQNGGDGITIQNVTLLVGQWDLGEDAYDSGGLVAILNLPDGAGSEPATYTISNCHVRGIDDSSFIKGNNEVGGIIGYLGNYSYEPVRKLTTIIENCTVNLDLTGTTYPESNVGGIIGEGAPRRTDDTLIKNCSYSGDIFIGDFGEKDSSNAHAGGIVGQANRINFVNCFSQGSIVVDRKNPRDSDAAGGIVGHIYGSDIPENNDEIKDYSKYNYIENCHSAMDVSGVTNVGGLAGFASFMIFKNSSASGNVTGLSLGVASDDQMAHREFVGGLIGHYKRLPYHREQESGEELIVMDNCVATGNVLGKSETPYSSTSSSTGGLIGYLEYDSYYSCDVVIQNSYATGDVTGFAKVGGFVGTIYAYARSPLIRRCYATGNVKADTRNTDITTPSTNYNINTAVMAGGFAGNIRGTSSKTGIIIENCYATGGVSGVYNNGDKDINDSSARYLILGGFAGLVSGGAKDIDASANTFTDCYYQGALSIDYNNFEFNSEYSRYYKVKAGGFIGQSGASSTFTRCYAKADTSSTNRVPNALFTTSGGFYGHTIEDANNVKYVDCYAVVTGLHEFSGYEGDNWKPAKGFGMNASGYPNIVLTNSFYDSTLHISSSYPTDAPGKTTAEMMTAGTFTDWVDFANNWDITTVMKKNPEYKDETQTPGVPEFIVDTANSTYPTQKAEKFNIPQSNISSISQGSPFSVPVGTSFDALPLPSVVSGTAVAPQTFVVKWDNTNYDSSKGDRLVYGDVYYGAAFTNTSNQRASVMVSFVPEIMGAEITGNAKVGEKLTAIGYDQVTGGSPIASGLSYIWKADGAVINSAVASTYELTAAQEGKKITVDITFNGKTVTAKGTEAVVKGDFAPLPVVTTVAATGKLTVSWVAAKPTPDSYNIYYKQSDKPLTAVNQVTSGTKIADVKSPQDIEKLEDGKMYYVVVEAVKVGYNSGYSAIKGDGPNTFPTDENTSITAERTELYVGEEYTVNAVTGGSNVTYTWSGEGSMSLKDGGEATQIITAGSYDDYMGDNNKGAVSVTATSVADASKTGKATKEFKVIPALDIDVTTSVGTMKVGQEVKATPRLIKEAQELLKDPSFTFQWGVSSGNLSDYVDVDGATSDTYTPTVEQGGKYLVLYVTLTNNGKTETDWYSIGYINEGDPVGSLTIAQDGASTAGTVKLTIKADMTTPDATAYAGKEYTLYYDDYAEKETVDDLISGGKISETKGVFGDEGINAAITLPYQGKQLNVVLAIKADRYNHVYSNILPVISLASLQSVAISDTTTVAQTISAQGIGLTNGNTTKDVTYQWQWSETNSKDDKDWADIAEAIEADYVIDGKYYQKWLRVKVIGDEKTTTGMVYSTAKEITGAAQFEAVPVITSYVGADSQVVLSWTGASPAPDRYDVYFGATKFGDVTKLTETVTGLSNGTNYNFKVVAVKAGYTDASSSEVTTMPFVHASGAGLSLDKDTVTKGETAVATATTTPENAGPVSYKWTASPINAVTFSDDTVKNPTITTVNPGEVTIRVTVTNKDGSTVWAEKPLKITNNAADMLTFKVDGRVAAIDGENITLTLPNAADLSALIPSFTISLGATVKIGEIEQVSGTTENDFTTAVTYNVTAEDGTTTKSYTVTIDKADLTELTAPDNTAFKISPEGVASWEAVAEAESYLVQLYCGDSTVGSAVSVSEVSHGFLTAMQANGVGEYTFTVTAVADPKVNLNSLESKQGGSFTLNKIVSIAPPVAKTVAQDTAESEADLPTTVVATLSSGDTVSLPVSWKGYDATVITTLHLDGILGTLPNNVINDDSILVPSLTLNVVAQTYEIKASAGAGGTITPSGTVTVTKGDSKSFTIVASSGYTIGSVTVDGKILGAIGTYLFENVSENHTISATFNSTGGSDGGDIGGGGGSVVAPPPVVGGETTAGSTVTTDAKLNGTSSKANITSGGVDSAMKSAGTGGNVVLDVNVPDGAKDVTVTIPSSSADALANAKNSVTVNTDLATVTFNSTAVNNLAEAGTGDISVTVSEVDNSSLPANAKAIIGDRPVYDFTVKNGNTEVSDFGGGIATVSVPYTLKPGENPSDIVIFYLASDGTMHMVTNCVYDVASGKVLFNATHFSKYAVSYNNITFKDVADTAWYSNAVSFVSARGLFSGVDKDSFAPQTTMTRAMFATVIARLDGADLSSYTVSKFTDVDINSWYGKAVAWAADKAIVGGIGSGLYAPDKDITREEMAVMLSNYIKFKGISLKTTGNSGDFADSASISAWARDAVKDMKNYGIISGVGGNNFNPQGNATRGEVAQVFSNFVGVMFK